MTKLKVIGLTGGISSGKSLAGKILSPYFERVIDADLLVHELYSTNQELIQAIEESFGSQVIVDGAIHRPSLRKIVFQDKEHLTQLERVVNPAIRKAIHAEIDMARVAGVQLLFQIPLMFENNLDSFFDAVLLIACSEKKQIQRVCQRDGCDEKEAKRILGCQMSLKEKRQRADFCIENDGSLQEFEESLTSWYKLYVAAGGEACTI